MKNFVEYQIHGKTIHDNKHSLKIWAKMEILVKNGNFGKKWKFW